MKKVILYVLLCYLQIVNAQIKDDTAYLQGEINKLSDGGMFNGKGKTFNVTSIWLKSNISIKNFKLVSIPTKSSDVSVICIGNDLSTNSYNKKKEAIIAYKNSANKQLRIKNISIENISIDGNRINHPFNSMRDGGKHGISIKGFVSNIIIRNVLIQNCVTDGISIYRGLHTSLDTDNKELFAANNITLDNVISENNGRHGGSGDSIKGFISKNCKFRNNGKDFIKGDKISKGWYYNKKQYGNGWDMEGYGLGSGLQNIEFNNSEFVDNVGAGLVFYDTVDSRSRGFVQRENLKILNCIIDSGIANPSGEFAFIISGTIDFKNCQSIYNNIQIRNTNLYGRFLCRSCGLITVENTSFLSDSPNKLLLDNVEKIQIKCEILPQIEKNKVKTIEKL
ncbi:hypothetical protein BWK59_01265 [Flavobacterium davisii]|uniref:Right handed beta helix domain-containing protein n=1 Tax=Flavobacterium davisii TaxID=2906077 RepID=A0A2D0AIY7_9FLAO|nr:hypothetical protein [Flavobacterium davisii]OWP85200.1 hypothetical protein BWK59_01265 [Flavobacterium davisii]